MNNKVAEIEDTQLEEIKKLEEKLGVVLIAFEKNEEESK